MRNKLFGVLSSFPKTVQAELALNWLEWWEIRERKAAQMYRALCRGLSAENLCVGCHLRAGMRPDSCHEEPEDKRRIRKSLLERREPFSETLGDA
jgi:hypothetical protein